jgi:2'-5' RNA ligase
MSRIRTFIAVDPGKAIRDRIIALQKTLGRAATEVKWVEPDNLHVTLLFLGEVEDREVPAVCRAVEETAAKHSAFLVSVEKTGCFPNVRRPRVLWVGIGEGTQTICSLHDDLEEPLLELGCYRREERRYTPHITLGRIRSDPTSDMLSAALAQQAGWKGGDATIQEVLVMSSQLTPDGPLYTVLSRARLGGVNSGK